MQLMLQPIHIHTRAQTHIHTHARTVSLCSALHTQCAHPPRLRVRHLQTFSLTISSHRWGSALRQPPGALSVADISPVFCVMISPFSCLTKCGRVENVSINNESFRYELGILNAGREETRSRLFSRLRTERFVYAKGGLHQEGKK